MILSTQSNPQLARKVAKAAKTKVEVARFQTFACGERCAQIVARSLRDQPVVFGSLQQPDQNFFDFLLLSNAVRHKGKKKPIAVVPYLGYARQDRTDRIMSSVAAEVVAGMIESAGVKKVVIVDAHSDKAISYFKIPVVNMSALPLFLPKIKSWKLKDPVFVSPDKGAIKRAKAMAKLYGTKSVAVVEKKRPKPGKVVATKLTGNVRGRDAVIVDDMIDTGGTLIAAAKLLKRRGALSVSVVATHGIFSKNALKNLKRSSMSRIVVTDTIPQKNKLKFLSVVSTSKLLAESI